jgi:mono/diheme cytochrome c family protein
MTGAAWVRRSVPAVGRRHWILAGMIVVGVAVIAAGAVTVAGSLMMPLPPDRASPHFADADDADLVAAGRIVYTGNCASCHGRRLQGQPLWQLIDQYAGRRAPAHDETGHTWQHSDEAIFAMTKYGRFPGEPAARASFMPAFAGKLSDRDILAVSAFIKSRWPLGLRVSQAMLNPGFAGMPRDADQVEWRLPPTCNAVLRRAEIAGFR